MVKNDLKQIAFLAGRNLGKQQIASAIFYKALKKKIAIESIRAMKFY